MKWALLLFSTLTLAASQTFANVRTVSLKHDQLLTVKTALGIATIIQTPDAVQSAIIGDQSGFKVEYLDNAVTIKPLRYAAKTNLYLMTAKQRFNIRLQTLGQDVADYIVYVTDRDVKPRLGWITLTRSVSFEGLTLTINRVARSSDGILLVDGTITSQSSVTLKPEYFWVLQERTSKVVESIFLTELEVKKNKPVRFGLAVQMRELDLKKSVFIQLKPAEKPLSIKISEVEWKK